MSEFFFMKYFIENFNKKNVFTRTFATVLRALTVISIIAAIVIWILLWKIVFEIPSAGIAGGVIFQIFFLVGIYMASHAAFMRAKDIAKLKTGDYTVVAVVTVFLKLLGEIYSSLTTAVALGGGILIWFAGGYGLQLLEEIPKFIPQYGGGTTFLGGLVFLIGGLVFAFFIIIAFYFAAEFFNMITDIAVNTKKASTK